MCVVDILKPHVDIDFTLTESSKQRITTLANSRRRNAFAKEGSIISQGIISEKKRERERRKNEKLRTFSYDSNVEAVIMSHFLNRAVILDSSDKRKSITHLIAPLCDRCIEYHRVASSARGKARRVDERNAFAEFVITDDTGTIRRPLNTQDIGVKSLSVHLTPEYMVREAHAYVEATEGFTEFSLELDSVSCITSMSLLKRVQIELEIVSTLTKARQVVKFQDFHAELAFSAHHGEELQEGAKEVRPLMVRGRNAVIDFDSRRRPSTVLLDQPDTLRPGISKLDSVNPEYLLSFIFIQHSVTNNMTNKDKMILELTKLNFGTQS
ncbi:hypothetical protein G5I_13577 [Acromyrmex echinatior]|uniref:Uncharacterized protein n=1 Tax=Acromyrmex echinatior TaxID=103372 RepID=F4X5E5_ACREC|nr:hypothetical protein G5I_13577 [Acromyrmex echinatior]